MEQALRLMLALALGAGLGLLYDLIRPLRRRAGKAAPLLDVLFAVLSAAAAFFFACAAPDARLGIWELAAALLGFLGWESCAERLRRRLLWLKSWDHTKKDRSQAKFLQNNTSKN